MGGWKDYLRKMLGWWSSPEAAELPTPPYRIAAGQVAIAGSTIQCVLVAGVSTGMVAVPGSVKGQIYA